MIGAVLTTLWFWLVFAITAPLLLVLGTLLFLVTAPFDPDRRMLHGFVSRWVFQYLRVSPLWRAKVRGRELLPDGPCVMVANHQSMADVVAAMGLFHPFKFVSKASLFSVPLVGWMMRMLRYVEIERGRHGSTRDMMDECRVWLRRGMPVLLFPEGTYSEGGALLPFKRGAFMLAIQEQVPLVPVLLRGTSQLIRGDGPWMNARARVEVEVLPPVMPEAQGSDPAELSARMRQLFSEQLGR